MRYANYIRQCLHEARDVKIPPVLYHGTKASLLPAIQQEGLRPDLVQSGSHDRGVFLAVDRSTAVQYPDYGLDAGDSRVVLAIDTAQLNPYDFGPDLDDWYGADYTTMSPEKQLAYSFEAVGQVVYNGVVPPSAITVSNRMKEAVQENPALKQWFGRSIVRDGQGQPLVVYHGTDAVFDQFDHAFAGNGPSKFGFWFTADKNFSSVFGANQMPVYLKLERPRTITTEKWNDIRDNHAKDGAWFAAWRDRLKAAGHDGLFVKGQSWTSSRGLQLNDPDIYAVFEPTQIKSASATRFDANSPKLNETKDWVIPPRLHGVITREVLTAVVQVARKGHASNNVVQSPGRDFSTMQTDVAYALRELAKQVHPDGTIRCYRTMNVDEDWFEPITEPRSLGLYWSYNENFTMGDHGHGRQVLLVADVPVQSVDWVDTILLAMDNVEDEIRLQQGAPLRLIYTEPEIPMTQSEHRA